MFIRIFPVGVKSPLRLTLNSYKDGVFINLHHLIYFRDLDLKCCNLEGLGVELQMNVGSTDLSYFHPRVNRLGRGPDDALLRHLG